MPLKRTSFPQKVARAVIHGELSRLYFRKKESTFIRKKTLSPFASKPAWAGQTTLIIMVENFTVNIKKVAHAYNPNTLIGEAGGS